MGKPHVVVLFLCSSASGSSVPHEVPREGASSSSKSSLMRAEHSQTGARSIALSSLGRPEPIPVAPAHSMIEEHSFTVDANGQKEMQKRKKKTMSVKSQVEVESDCADEPNDPLCARQNRTSVVDVQKEIDLTEMMIDQVALYCCCEAATVSARWQEHLRKGTVPGYCKKSWYNQYCTGLNSEYSPSEAVLNRNLGREQQVEMCDVCHECFQKKCPYWAEDQKQMKLHWINTITCKDATTRFREQEPEVTDVEVKRNLAEAEACASGSLKCPSNILLAFQEFPVMFVLLIFLFAAQCGAGVWYINARYQAAEELKGADEHEPILDPSLISDIKDD